MQKRRILIIQQKPCQTINSLIMKGMIILGGAEKCANPHVFCAIPHTQHNEILLIFAKIRKT